ncbi:MAG: hypothetical protein K8H88_22200, partial [Sandaracinaceae bacterium]|nr:hypothetical protein [Sandaracinaceae bacterium]
MKNPSQDSFRLDPELLARGRARGFLSYDEVTEALSRAGDLGRAIPRALKQLSHAGISLSYDDAGRRRDSSKDDPSVRRAPGGDPSDTVERYLGRLGDVALLTRDGEIELARQIERGREAVLGVLWTTRIRMPEIGEMQQRLEADEISVREVVAESLRKGTDEESAARQEALDALRKV